MRQLRRNQLKIKYSTLLGESEIYRQYTDSDGNTYPIGTGQNATYYSTPIEFMTSMSMSGSEAEAMEYGLSTADYQAVLSCSKNSYPIVEGTIIWVTSEVRTLYDNEIEVTFDDGTTATTNAPIKESADYVVIKCSPSLNEDKFILKAVNK